MASDDILRSGGILGILDLKPGSALQDVTVTGPLHDPETFPFSTMQETVAGAGADVVVRGDPDLEAPYIASAKRLVERGAVAITADCGFSIRHQAAVAAAVQVPVALSSLLLAPVILRQLPVSAKLAVLTFDASHLETELLGLSDANDLHRVVIGGIENTQTWKNEMQRPPSATDIAVMREEVCTRTDQLREKHPEIGAVLLECTMFPRLAQSVRRNTGLPVFDITTLCRTLMESVCGPVVGGVLN
ncbi:hypothetical protein [Mesorhizobium sp. LNHC229A00]|uniref:hypothetical protein n=1 Tax=Mesorhizobium sp. LNHC229A00 TaxID=1287240 RepID=UPI0003CEB01F|nr:hypothetical protein [Mesorhizobium sp. LNHC229A00]ESY90379.1 hypothetical protein X741_26895 [Mesorhizobium sp. LNHC229A00]